MAGLLCTTRRYAYTAMRKARSPPRRGASERPGGATSPLPVPDRCLLADPRDIRGAGVMTVMENVFYSEGRRLVRPDSLTETYQLLHGRRDRRKQDLAWIGLVRPDQREIASIAREFELHELAVEDAVQAHQRSKLERYGKTLFVVLLAASYNDTREEVEFSELHVFVGDDFVITVRHGDAPDLRRVRHRMESEPDLLARGPEAVLYAILDRVVDDYAPVVAGLENDIDEIETEVFRGDPEVSRRIYELSREVIEFQRATKPLLGMLDALASGFVKYGVDAGLQQYLRDVSDHVVQVVERIEGFRQLLQNILTANAALVGQRQNEEMKILTETSIAQNEEVKKISAWAAILFAPTLVGTVYGMNFETMPELQWTYGYPFAIGLMGLVSAMLYVVFRSRRWL
ncbi:MULTISPECIES: magnesium/cobalt transporter CorA [unclassified Frankia]|uniref:magnesium/cobalt transporter CorA n=1 Tax=unclassified Frankia TaxID=2632575 RepID=UPI0040449B58